MYNVTWDDLHAQMAWKSVKSLTGNIADNSSQMLLGIRNANQAPRSTFYGGGLRLQGAAGSWLHLIQGPSPFLSCLYRQGCVHTHSYSLGP